MGNFGPWSLTAAEQARLDAYQKAQDLVSKAADQWDLAYQREKAKATGGIVPPQLWVNIPGLVARTAADLILSQAPALKNSDANVQTRLAALALRSQLYKLAWRSVYWLSIQGDAFLIIQDVTQAANKPLPLISLRRATGSVARGIRTEDPSSARKFLFRSSILNGAAVVDLYLEMLAGRNNWTVSNGALPAGYPPTIETREDVPLAVHLAALRGDATDENFGEADSAGTEDLCFEISNRLRQVSKILNRHAEPAMNVPDGAMDEGGALAVADKKVFERGVDGSGAEYITWQSQLAEAYTEIDKILDLILLLSETPAALWGRDKNGQAESGRALKFRLLAGLGKARRTGGMLKEALATAARLALRREDILAGHTPGEYQVDVGLPDTFIADETETVDKIVKLRQAGVMSVRQGVEDGQGLSGADLDAEVQAIEDEAGQAPVGFGGGIASQNAAGA